MAHNTWLTRVTALSWLLFGCDGATTTQPTDSGVVKAIDASSFGDASRAQPPHSDAGPTATMRGSEGGDAAAAAPSSDAATGTQPDAALTFTPGELPKQAPGWLATVTPGTWKAISMNTLKDVDPNDDPQANPSYPSPGAWQGNSQQNGLLTAWGGGAFAYGWGKYGALLVWGGGHQDYFGNEVYAFDVEQLKWLRLSNPYPTPMFHGVDSYPEGRYPDGTPVSPHSVDMLEYHPRTNSLVTLQAETNNLGGYTTTTAYMFSLESKQWRRSRVSREALGSFGWSAYDSKRDLFWTEGGYFGGENPTSTFDPNPGQADGTYGVWTNYVSQINTNGCAAAYDPLHDVVIVTVFRSGEEVRAIDVTSPTQPARALKQSGSVPALHQGHGWEWSATRRAFVYWAGDDVYEFKPSAGDWKQDAWVWSDITNPQNRVDPDYTVNGVYGRFRIANYGGVEVAYTVNSNRGSVYAFRIP